jgi:hypothetical protein
VGVRARGGTTGDSPPVLLHSSLQTTGVMWQGGGRSVNVHVLCEMARRRPVPSASAPVGTTTYPAVGLQCVVRRRRTSARRLPEFAYDWSVNVRPRPEACTCANHGRERSASDSKQLGDYAGV